MLIRSDDDLARYKPVFLGMRGMKRGTPWKARYLAYGLFFGLWLVLSPTYVGLFALLGLLPGPVPLLVGGAAAWPLTRMARKRLLDEQEGGTKTALTVALAAAAVIFLAPMTLLVSSVHPLFSLPWAPATAILLTLTIMPHVDHDRTLRNWYTALVADISAAWAARSRRRALRPRRFTARYKNLEAHR